MAKEKTVEKPRFKAGSKVMVKVGRGVFPGKVVDIDEEGKWGHVKATTAAGEKTYLRRLSKLVAA